MKKVSKKTNKKKEHEKSAAIFLISKTQHTKRNKNDARPSDLNSGILSLI